MIIPVNFPLPSSSNEKLPPALAKISHDEVVLIELQGALEVESTHARERDGKLVGKLNIDDAAKKPTLMIGHHLLEGKVAQLPKPLAVLKRVVGGEEEEEEEEEGRGGQPDSCSDAMEVDGAEPRDSTTSRGPDAARTASSWDAIAVIKRKIIFAKRPMPIVGRPS